jgi:hypothetical protein
MNKVFFKVILTKRFFTKLPELNGLDPGSGIRDPETNLCRI